MTNHSLEFTLPSGWKIIQPKSPEDLAKYLQLRFEVLRKPWGQDIKSTLDELENISVHFLLLNDQNNAIASGRLQLNSDSEGQIRSMAVDEKFRGKGIGHYMIYYLELEAKARGMTSIILDAREPALNFYLKNNYKVIEDSYLLFGIIKHFKMQKDL